jgi:hypothetical protein
MQQERDINRDWALRLAEAGLAVFPCGPDKKPLIKWREFSSSDPEAVAMWWTQHPNALPGIDLEKCDLVVLDGDRHGGPDGRAALRELLQAQPDYNAPATPRAFTPSDGAHVYFCQNGHELTNSRGSLPEGIDVRGAGGYTIAPYAVLPDGRRYRAVPKSPDLISTYKAGTVPPIPEGIVALLEARRKANGKPTESSETSKAGIRERSYAQAALDGCTKELADCQPGNRNELLNALAYRLGRMIARGWLHREHVEANLSGAMHTNGYVEEKGIRAVEATPRSGWMPACKSRTRILRMTTSRIPNLLSKPRRIILLARSTSYTLSFASGSARPTTSIRSTRCWPPGPPRDCRAIHYGWW